MKKKSDDWILKSIEQTGNHILEQKLLFVLLMQPRAQESSPAHVCVCMCVLKTSHTAWLMEKCLQNLTHWFPGDSDRDQMGSIVEAPQMAPPALALFSSARFMQGVAHFEESIILPGCSLWAEQGLLEFHECDLTDLCIFQPRAGLVLQGCFGHGAGWEQTPKLWSPPVPSRSCQLWGPCFVVAVDLFW